MPAFELSASSVSKSDACAVTVSLRSVTFSRTISAVMILVVEAGYRRSSAFFSYSTMPVSGLTSSAASALVAGAPDAAAVTLSLLVAPGVCVSVSPEELLSLSVSSPLLSASSPVSLVSETPVSSSSGAAKACGRGTAAKSRTKHKKSAASRFGIMYMQWFILCFIVIPQ